MLAFVTMRLLSPGARCIAVLACLVTTVAACGAGAPPIDTLGFVGNVDAGSEPGPINAPEGGLVAPDAAPPSCEAGSLGGVCGCLELSLLSDPPNLYFVLDRSGSMTDLDKWTTVRNVIADVMHRIGPRARFGAAVFPDPTYDSCNVGVQVMPMTLGDSPAGTYGPTTARFTAGTNYPASGGTPTAATFQELTPILEALPGKTFAILATDGGPNCDANITCDASACIPNIESTGGCLPQGASCCASDPLSCLDGAAAVQAITALQTAGVSTYVIGVPGSGPYAGVLNQMALAGGTARPTSPYYFDVTTADEAAFTAALTQIAAKVTATCTLTLSEAPPDPSNVNVYLDGNVVPADPTNGWTLSGSTVTLEGTTCDSVLQGNVLSLRVVAGCPTVLK
jgi:hypothetical protein